MKELTVFVFYDNEIIAAEQEKQLSSLSEADERIEVITLRDIAELSAALESAEGRYVKILWNGERILQEQLEQILNEIEKTEADVFVTGYRQVRPSEGSVSELLPVCSCVNRQIDMIKLAEKYDEIRSCLWAVSLCYYRSFLKNVLEKTGDMLFEEDSYAILPFVQAESIYIVPELMCEYNSDVHKTPGIDPKMIKCIVDYYESVRPMGKARDEFLRKKIAAVVIRRYVYLLTTGPDKKTGRARAAHFRKDLMENAPMLAKNTERKYKVLRRIGHYKVVSKRALNEC